MAFPLSQAVARRPVCWASAVAISLGCGAPPAADLLLVNGRVYSLAWEEPGPAGRPGRNAPYDAERGWHPDAEAVAIRGQNVVFVGTNAAAERYRGADTRVLDLAGGTVLPGLVDSHVHVADLGANLARIDLVGIDGESAIVDSVAARATTTPPGEWILGYGWDEGAWADRYPDMERLSLRVPDHPVYLRGLHGFAAWGNRLAFERAGITRETRAPAGGEVLRDTEGEPSGILTNRAVALLDAAVPEPTPAQLEARIEAALGALAAAGYTGIHEAGADAATMAALERLERADRLPIRVYAMLSARDEPLLRRWLSRGPDTDSESMLRTRAVKAYYDGALGSRGARLLADYADRPGHRGVSGAAYGFDRDLMIEMIGAGFQVAIHAIGDAGNREVLDFFQHVAVTGFRPRDARHRIEHAQVVHPDDLWRFARFRIIASLEPAHAVEDKAWAAARLGPERVKHAYAWRTLRRAGARLVFNSDLPGSDHDIFYGLHAAITRRDRRLEPREGWFPEQRMRPEEAVRGYTTWAAHAGFTEAHAGLLAPGRWADLTVMDLDPFVVGATNPERLLSGTIVATIVGGEVVYAGNR